jgi:hypothetical protein
VVFLWSLFSPGAWAASKCEAALGGAAESGVGLVAADFFEQNRRLPTPQDLNRLMATETDVTADRIPAHITRVATETPELFRDMKLVAAQKVMKFALSHLRFPDETELLDTIGWRVDAAAFARVGPAILGERLDFLDFAREAFPRFEHKIVDKLSAAYLRALSQRDVPKHLRTQLTRPSEERVFQALLELRGNAEVAADVAAGRFDQDQFRRLIGSLEPRPGDLRVIDGGVAAIEDEARLDRPGKFANFVSPDSGNLERALRLKTALEEKKGFLITSVNAGIALVEDMYATMLKYAEDLDYDIIVYPTNNMTHGIDQRLLDHPRIHIITHTIKNRFIRFYGIGILPKNQNPFASLNKPGQFKPGQITIVGSPQLRMQVIPTSSNHLREAILISPGSLSENYYPFEHYVQDRTSKLAHQNHSNSFVVLEKADARSGYDGVENVWHPRSVMFTNDPKDLRRGFTDMGRQYYVSKGKVRVDRQEPDASILGDLHEAETSQQFLKAYQALLELFPANSLDVYLHDSINNGSSNHHEFNNIGLLIQKLLSGELDIARELRGLVQFDNALARVKSVHGRHYADSNHTYWLSGLLNAYKELHEVLSGKILAELRFARDVLNLEPLEYILRRRQSVIEGLPPEIRQRFDEREIFTHDPLGISVLPKGEPQQIGPAHRPVHVSNHGHLGGNGARGSEIAHAAGQESSVSGDSHRAGIYGSYVNVGTATPKRLSYSMGGYSSWTNASALVYPDGTIQLLMFNTSAGTIFARPEAGSLSRDDFFGDEPLKIEHNDNEMMQGVTIVDQYTRVVSPERSRRKGTR